MHLLILPKAYELLKLILYMKKTSKIWVKKGIKLTFTLTKNNTNFDTIGHIRSIKCVFEKSKTYLWNHQT